MVRRLGASFPVKVAILSAYQTLGYDRPTEDQERAFTKFVYGHDVFISLPTDSCKSLCFICLPLGGNFPSAVQDENCVVLVLGEAASCQPANRPARPRLPTRDVSAHTDGAGPYGLRKVTTRNACSRQAYLQVTCALMHMRDMA